MIIVLNFNFWEGYQMYDSLVAWNNIYKKNISPSNEDSSTIIRRQTHIAVNIGVALLVICYLIGDVNRPSNTADKKENKRHKPM